MSKISFVNYNKSTEQEHSLNTLISFRSYEEYLKLKDMDKQDLHELIKARNREQLEKFLIEKAANSNKFKNIIEKSLEKFIQDELDDE